MADKAEAIGLFRLSAEVRNIIWEYALTQDKPIKILTQPRQPGISRTCSQFREETLPMFYHINCFVVENLHYICNYEHRFRAPAFCTYPTCSSKRVRPADWIETIGYKYLKHITNIQLKESTMGWLSAFDLRLEQDVKNKLLRHRAGSHWKAYVNREHKDTTVRKERMDWCCSDFESPLPDLLQEVIDRLDEPGLSPQAIQAIVKDLTTDFGLTTFLPTLAADQRRFVEYWPTHLIYKLLTCPYSEIRGLTEDEDIPDVMGSVLHDTILQLRPRFQEVRQTALVATGHMSYVRDDPFAALESD